MKRFYLVKFLGNALFYSIFQGMKEDQSDLQTKNFPTRCFIPGGLEIPKKVKVHNRDVVLMIILGR